MASPQSIVATEVTLDTLAQIFAGESFEFQWFTIEGQQEPGLMVVVENVWCTVELSDLLYDEWRYLTFTVFEEVRETAGEDQILAFVHRVNQGLKMLRAWFNGEDVIFDYTAVLTGELSREWFVTTLGAFDYVVQQAKETLDTDGVLEDTI